MTINEIITTINTRLQTERMTEHQLATAINEMIPGILLQREKGIYIRTRRGDSDEENLICIKVKRNKERNPKYRGYGGNAYELVAKSVTLVTPEVGELTPEALYEQWQSQVAEQRERNDEQARQDYLAIKSVMDKTDMSMGELLEFAALVRKYRFGWDKMVERFGGQE